MICDLQWAMINDLSEPYLALRTCYCPISIYVMIFPRHLNAQVLIMTLFGGPRAHEGSIRDLNQPIKSEVNNTCYQTNEWHDGSQRRWDLNPLDYYFWDTVKTKVYEGRIEPFASVEQLTRRIKYVWDDAIDEAASHKAILQFRKRLRAVVVNNGVQSNIYFAKFIFYAFVLPLLTN